ncbi:MAG: ribokinase [Bacteroidaceae bacterium]|nr:ribokinase [Bacteroidaceae bacterium]
MEKTRIVVVGSCNTDLVISVDHLPAPGETIIGHDFMTNQGGKGANQAVAVARLGGTTAFVARVGDDGFGRQSIALLKEEGIDTRHVLLTEGVATGVAMIPVDCRGENSIIVASGANALLTPADIDAAADTIREAGIVLMQLETPVDTLIRAARLAREGGALVVLNPAPFPKEPLPAELLALVDIITPNETEASMMAGISVTDEASALQAILKIQATGIKQVILTAGSKGAYTAESGSLVNIPAVKTEVVDTTAAGDTFCGALCVALSEGNGLTGAIRFANRAAALSVTRRGAWMSIPKRGEID